MRIKFKAELARRRGMQFEMGLSAYHDFGIVCL